MSNKKPNLTIQIEQSGDEYNSKFQGYVVDYPNQDQLIESQSKVLNNQDVYSSRVSQKSNLSNASQRSAILERAEQLLIEERLEQNIKSLSKNKMKGTSLVKNSNINTVASQKSNKIENRSREDRIRYDKTRISQSQQDIIRSKSANSINAEQSRAKVLQQIAQKLKKIQKIKKDDEIIETKSQVHYQANSRLHSEENSDTHSRVERIKQIKEQMIKNRGGKLEHLLKDIKKSNKQAYKVVYTIKKCSKNGSPFEKSLQMRDKIHEQSKRVITNTTAGTNLFNLQKADTLKKIADELQNVRMELKQVKNKNDQLLHLSQSRSAHNSYAHYNIDSGSQSSRVTHQIQALEFDIASNSSRRRPNSPQNGPINGHPSFSKGQHKNSSLYTAKNPSYQIIEQPGMIQPCFACGCICKMKSTLIK